MGGVDNRPERTLIMEVTASQRLEMHLELREKLGDTDLAEVVVMVIT